MYGQQMTRVLLERLLRSTRAQRVDIVGRLLTNEELQQAWDFFQRLPLANIRVEQLHMMYVLERELVVRGRRMFLERHELDARNDTDKQFEQDYTDGRDIPVAVLVATPEARACTCTCTCACARTEGGDGDGDAFWEGFVQDLCCISLEDEEQEQEQELDGVQEWTFIAANMDPEYQP